MKELSFADLKPGMKVQIVEMKPDPRVRAEPRRVEAVLGEKRRVRGGRFIFQTNRPGQTVGEPRVDRGPMLNIAFGAIRVYEA